MLQFRRLPRMSRAYHYGRRSKAVTPDGQMGPRVSIESGRQLRELLREAVSRSRVLNSVNNVSAISQQMSGRSAAW